MALVGDVIMRARRLIPDPPQVYPPPAIVTAVAQNISGGIIAQGTYTVALTAVTQWGETIGSAFSSVTVGAGQNDILVTYSAAGPGGTHIRAYLMSGTIGTAAIYDFPNALSNNVSISQGTLIGNANPPSQNSAFLPDTDGVFASAPTVFDWLNEALRELSRTCGGIRDYAGVQAINGQPMYVLPSNWIAITDIWYAGYWMQGGQRGNFFRANKIIAQILTSATVSVQDNRTILEVYPQPANSGGSTTLTAAMGLTDTVVSVANQGFVSLPFGFIQVDSEIMAYANLGSGKLTGLVRGLGGNVPATHAIGAPAIELNLVINGRRIFGGSYVPGNSAIQMPIPPGWSDILTDYVMYMARQAEQEYDKAEGHLKNFGKKTAEWARSNSNAVKRRQIGPASVPEAYYGGVPGGGGWIIG